MGKLEPFEGLIYPDQREYLRRIKNEHRFRSIAQALRYLIDEYRKSAGTLPEERCLTDKVQ